MTEAGNDLVETVPMPKAIQQAVADFVAEHHVERAFAKRKRDRADPEALGRRPLRDDEQPVSEPEKFLDRWSRRKREAADEPAPVEAKHAAVASAPPADAATPAAEPPFDPASLPPIE